jgi:hypothetical protein
VHAIWWLGAIVGEGFARLDCRPHALDCPGFCFLPLARLISDGELLPVNDASLTADWRVPVCLVPKPRAGALRIGLVRCCYWRQHVTRDIRERRITLTALPFEADRLRWRSGCRGSSSDC